MCELAAQVTSSLLRFPEVTLDALGEDEITLDSVLHGKFTIGRSGLAWLACGPHLEVVQVNTGERFSAYRFSGVSEHAPCVLAARDFCWLKRTGLLLGLEEAEGSILCLYDLAISRVVKAVVIPGRITAIEPLVSYGGASASTQHLHQSLRWFFGVAAVVTDVGHVLLVDLCLDDPSCSQSELEASDLEVVNKSPAEIPHIRERVTQQGRHLCLQLSSPTGTSATALQYVTRTNQLAVGFSDGYLQLWNMKTLKKEYHSQLEGGRVPVYAFTFQEPENDPRNCCYLWAVQSTQDHEGDVVSLHLLQLAFGERKCLASGKILYEGLEYCEERYSQDLSGTAFPLRAQATNTRLLSCQTIEKFRHHPDRDDSMNEGASPDTRLDIQLASQVVRAGQALHVRGGVRYQQMVPRADARLSEDRESLHNCPYLAVWSLDAVVEMTAPCPLLDVLVHERSLSRGLPYTCPPPEQFFNPTTYNFDATCLLNSGVVHVTCSGYQKETLSFLKRSAPSLSEAIPDGYSRCLMSGLLSPRLADVQPSTLSKEEQLDAILSAAVETSCLGLITGCIRQWTAEEQPGSAVNLRYILEWAWNKVVLTKQELDGICAPLFDSSSNFTDPQTLQLLQHSQRLLCNLSTIFHCLLNEAHELTEKGLVGLVNKNVVSSLISQYAQVVLWFCRTGLLPEGSDDDVLQISRPFYNYPVVKNYYTGRREELQRLSRGKWCSDCLMIDGLVGQFTDRIGDLWRRDEGGTGQYPPPTLHALLDIFLLENMEESAKHAIVIYLLLDVMYSLPNKSGALVESFPTAFAIPIGLVKLVQGLWLLDHHDHENSLELLLHPATSRSLWAWQHGRVLQALMCQGQHAIALRYLHTMSPPMASSSQIKLCLSVLLHNRCMVEAWAVLRQHSNKLNMEELLRFMYETCQELGLMKELLKLPLGLAEQECLERYLQGTGGLQNRELLMVHYLQQANYVPALQLNQALRMTLNDRDPKHKERAHTRNSILDQYGKVLPRVQRKLAMERAKPYYHPSTIHREVTRPQPLSTVTKRSATENVLSRAAFISNVLTKIGEVWQGKDGRPDASPLRSPRASGLASTSALRPSMDLPEAFVGTPITMSSRRSTRILDLIVRPSTTTSPEGLGFPQTPPRLGGPQATPGPASSIRGIARAPELSLLHTPQVVKRARALAASGPVFPGFTPQSILRSSLRPTPVGSPSASPGRSVTPPLRPKESRITFIEEAPPPDTDAAKGPVHWSNGIAAESEISLLSLASPHAKPGVESWSARPEEEEEEEEEEEGVAFVPVAQLLLEAEDSEREEEMGESESCCSVRQAVEGEEEEEVVGGSEISHASVQSVHTAVEFHDAPASEDLEDEQQELEEDDVEEEKEEEEEVVVANVKPAAPEVSLLPPICTGGEEQREAPAEAEQSPKQEEVEPNLEAENGLEQEDVEQSLEQEEAEQRTEHMGLDEFVEHHLFGDDFSPPLTRSSIRQAWTGASNSECSFDDREEEPAPAVSAPPALTTQKSVTSVSSGGTTSDSHSVVSLDDSEELSGASSEEDSEEAAEEEEDSESEVEIIEEVQGDGGRLFLQESPIGPGYLDEQASAVLSLVSPRLQLEAVDAVDEEEDEGEEEVVMLDLETEEPGEDGNGLVCYTELQPSDTLLVPLDLEDERQLDALCEPEEPQADTPANFTLTLEPEELENGLARPLEDSDVPLLIVQLPQGLAAKEQRRLDGQEVFCLDEADACEGASLLATRSKTSEEPTAVEQEGKELQQQNVVFANQQLKQEPAPAIELNVAPTKTVEEAELVDKSVEVAYSTGTKSRRTKDRQQVPLSETRRTPRQRKTVTFPSPVDEAENDARPEEERFQNEVDPEVPSTPRRITRRGKQGQDTQLPLTPRRVTRSSTEPHAPEEEPAANSTSVESKSEAAKHQTPQKTPPRTPRTRNSILSIAGGPEESSDNELPANSMRGIKKTRAMAEVPENETLAVPPPEDKDKAPSSPGRTRRKPTRGISFALEPPEEKNEAPSSPGRGPRKSSRGVSLALESQEEKVDEAPSSPGRGPRKSSRGTTLALEPPEEKNEAPSSPGRATRKSSRGTTLALEPPEEKNEAPSSPGRATRKSSRALSFAVETPWPPPLEQEPVTPKRSRRATRGGGHAAPSEEALQPDATRRSTRSHLWNHLEAPQKGEENEERLILDTPLEVEPGTEVADALMERLKDEGAKESKGGGTASAGGTTIIRARRRGASTAPERAPPTLPAASEAPGRTEDPAWDGPGREPEAEAQRWTELKTRRTGSPTRASKPSETDSSPSRDSLHSSPPQTRRKTRGRRADSPTQSHIFQPLVMITRTRQPTTSTLLHAVKDEENEMGAEDVKPKAGASKPKKKRMTRAKAASPPPMRINLISPMPSPADPPPGVDRKPDAPPQRMNLRRKRLLDTIFPKPVTRRKML
ncbi:hypothetical protein AAFF_G00202780 [Aldrovandia affinis]|uniref:AT hook containing transcription factor 1 n=1 Tax=Aldrovandia affinis TaxID=143900 RepID=A0AAD7SWX3_9TELE|nr:hypothetical protein AAFF_G00202780 [Aldrovandia affinis]